MTAGSASADADDPVPTDAEAFASSTSDFRIKGALLATSPDGGSAWEIGTDYDVEWETTGTINKVKIEYTTDGGSSWIR